MPTHVFLVVAELFHEFIDEVQGALARLSAPCSSTEDYVEKLTFLEDLIVSQRALDFRCMEIQALHALLEQYNIKLPDVHRAAYATLNSTYTHMKSVMEEVEGAKEEAMQKYSAELESGEWLFEDRSVAIREGLLGQTSAVHQPLCNLK